MGWHRLEREDLASALSGAEIEAYGSGAGFADVVGATLGKVAAAVRGFVRAGGRPVAPGEGLVPDALAPFALDVAAYRLLKRLDAPVSEDRRRANEAALSLLREVAAGRMAVDPPEGEEGSAPSGPPPAFAAPAPERRLD